MDAKVTLTGLWKMCLPSIPRASALDKCIIPSRWWTRWLSITWQKPQERKREHAGYQLAVGPRGKVLDVPCLGTQILTHIEHIGFCLPILHRKTPIRMSSRILDRANEIHLYSMPVPDCYCTQNECNSEGKMMVTPNDTQHRELQSLEGIALITNQCAASRHRSPCKATAP